MNIWKEKREDKPNKEEQQEKTEYAIYKGDEFLFIGTKKECAEFLKVSENTVMFYTTPTYRNRGLGEQGDRLIVLRVEDE